MKFLCFGLAWFAGLIVGAVAPITIITFAIPFTYEMKRKGVLRSTAPATRYIVSFVLLLGLFVAASWAMWHFFPKYIWGYVIGVLLIVLPKVRLSGRTATNVDTFFKDNAEHVDQEALSRYLAL